jgi:hypothetical protein
MLIKSSIGDFKRLKRDSDVKVSEGVNDFPPMIE